ncbi:DMT family transporter [Herbaspirillum robiniae]|uniref:DMT family transporter n=1 Tax=Herbaspirillum robiniae TaxID=2014887 RepID=A0A246WM55_9BURK|nr:DMT family transporter [Herbaspirillum robiniae]NUU03843.1 DMT family transporter [Herbaspirillum robiniae]OWY26436.1 EamA family transporter [Herbaspirillum robiniae]
MSYTPSRAMGYGCLILSMSMVGAYVALTKPLAAALPVFLLAWMRFGIGAVAMARWLKKPADEKPLSAQSRWLVFLESFLGNFLFTICMITGVSMTSAVSAGVIMSAIPAVVALMSWIFLKEKITLRVWGAVACGAIGIGMLSLAKNTHGDAGGAHAANAWLGNLLVFGAVLCEGSYAVIGKKLTAVLTPKRISAVINLWGLLLMTPMGFYTALRFDFGAVPANIWLLLVFYALAASVWTVWLWMTGLKVVPAGRAGVFTVMLPVSAALVGVVALGESLTLLQAGAFAVAMAGMLLATLPGRAARTTETELPLN